MHLKDTIAELPGKLEYSIVESKLHFVAIVAVVVAFVVAHSLLFLFLIFFVFLDFQMEKISVLGRDR